MKKKKVGISSWHKRYCEVDGPTLKYYDHYIRGADDNEPRGVIVLEDSPQYSINVTGSEFVIAGKYGAYIFQANSGHDALKWVEVRCRKRFVDLFFFFFICITCDKISAWRLRGVLTTISDCLFSMVARVNRL